MKTTSSGEYHVPLKSNFAFWDIVEHELKNGWNFCFMKTTSNRGYYVTFKSNFVLWDILEMTLKRTEIYAWYQNYIKWGI